MKVLIKTVHFYYSFLYSLSLSQIDRTETHREKPQNTVNDESLDSVFANSDVLCCAVYIVVVVVFRCEK